VRFVVREFHAPGKNKFNGFRPKVRPRRLLFPYGDDGKALSFRWKFSFSDGSRVLWLFFSSWVDKSFSLLYLLINYDVTELLYKKASV